MENKTFTEEDVNKVISYLNTVAKYAKFNISQGELISYFKLLAHMQQVIIPKLQANIYDIKEVVKNKTKK